MKHRTIMMTVALGLCGMLAGCVAQSENKQTTARHWESTLAGRRLAEIDNHINHGRLVEAKQTLERSLEAEPNLAQAHVLLGRVYYLEDRAHAAQTAFAKALELDETLDEAWYYLGILAFGDNDFDAAIEAYQAAITIKPNNIDYVITLAQLYIHTERYDRAEELLEQRLRRQPENRDLLIAMAELHQRLGHFDRTVLYYQQILLANPQDEHTLELIGFSYVAQKDWPKAVDTFERLLVVIQQDDRRESILDTLGLCALNARQYGRALRYYDQLTTLRRNDPEVWLNMARAALGAGLANRAVDNAQRALVLNPGWPQAFAVLGAAQYLQGHHTEALRSFSYLRNDDELGGFAWFMSGRCYAQLGRLAQAEAAYQQAGDRSTDGSLVSRVLNGDTL